MAIASIVHLPTIGAHHQTLANKQALEHVMEEVLFLRIRIALLATSTLVHCAPSTIIGVKIHKLVCHHQHQPVAN